jgi:hypothetical protein
LPAVKNNIPFLPEQKLAEQDILPELTPGGLYLTNQFSVYSVYREKPISCQLINSQLDLFLPNIRIIVSKLNDIMITV